MRIWYADQWIVTGRSIHDIVPLDPVGFSGEQAVEIAEFMRGATVLPIARSNRSQKFELQTAQQCESYEEAVRLAATALQQIGTSGELRIELDDGSALTTNPAVVRTCRPTRNGVYLQLAWEFAIGDWTAEGVTYAIWDGCNYATLPLWIRDGGWYGDRALLDPVTIEGGNY